MTYKEVALQRNVDSLAPDVFIFSGVFAASEWKKECYAFFLNSEEYGKLCIRYFQLSQKQLILLTDFKTNNYQMFIRAQKNDLQATVSEEKERKRENKQKTKNRKKSSDITIHGTVEVNSPVNFRCVDFNIDFFFI